MSDAPDGAEPHRADRVTDRLYEPVRARYGARSPRANGYYFHRHFLREQELVLEFLGEAEGLVLDVACGSGLMVLALTAPQRRLVGLDFNQTACRDARENGLDILRGDAFRLPFADNSVDRVLNCQFLNQQTAANAARFVHEAGRVLRPGGRLLIVWRNGAALVHRLAHGLTKAIDTITRQPSFPMVDHRFAEVRRYASEAGLELVEGGSSFPFMRRHGNRPEGLATRVLGASLLAYFEKRP